MCRRCVECVRTQDHCAAGHFLAAPLSTVGCDNVVNTSTCECSVTDAITAADGTSLTENWQSNCGLRGFNMHKGRAYIMGMGAGCGGGDGDLDRDKPELDVASSVYDSAVE